MSYCNVKVSASIQLSKLSCTAIGNFTLRWLRQDICVSITCPVSISHFSALSGSGQIDGNGCNSGYMDLVRGASQSVAYQTISGYLYASRRVQRPLAQIYCQLSAWLFDATKMDSRIMSCHSLIVRIIRRSIVLGARLDARVPPATPLDAG